MRGEPEPLQTFVASIIGRFTALDTQLTEIGEVDRTSGRVVEGSWSKYDEELWVRNMYLSNVIVVPLECFLSLWLQKSPEMHFATDIDRSPDERGADDVEVLAGQCASGEIGLVE